VYEQQGEVEKAIEEWERVLELSPPDSTLAHEAEQRLAALQPRK
jgi:cytochrome c-type biogenesis protein CcmH/NrfG